MSTVTLRPKQRALIDDIEAQWRAGMLNVLGVSPTGSGKTVMFSDIIEREQGITCAIAHRAELVGQMSLALARNGVRHSVLAQPAVVQDIQAIHMRELGRRFVDPHSRVIVAGVQTLVNRTPEWAPRCALWVVDECFPAGTQIDGRPIETIKVGDTVSAFNEQAGQIEQRRVVRLFRNPKPKRMVSVATAHHVVQCTTNHPFFTRRGWINAGEITCDDEVLCVQPNGEQSFGGVDAAISKDWTPLLQQSVLDRVQTQAIVRDDESDESSTCQRQNDRAQPDAQSRNTSQSFRDSASYQTQSEDSRRERATSTTGRGNAFAFVRGAGVCGSTSDCHGAQTKRRQRLPDLLQTGRGESSSADRDRGGRKQSFGEREKGARREEGCVLAFERVDSVEVQEQRDSDEPTDGIRNDHVYNFEVEGLHTYVANGFVVHNCHHLITGNVWGRAVSMFPNARGLGFTATPMRADGKGLGRHADGVFDAMCVGPGMRELIDDGHLSDYRIWAPPSDLDMTGVNVTASGDFSPAETAKRVHRSHIMGDIVTHYLRLARGKRGLTFTVDIAAAEETAEAYRQAGVPAEVLSGNSPTAWRGKVMHALRSGEILQVVNCDLLGEGTDVPAVEVVSFGRPTASYGLYVQQFGRVLRLFEGKQYGMIIDHVGNVKRHRLPDAGRDWTLDRRAARTNGVSDAVPVATCAVCEGVYERVLGSCPYCAAPRVPARRDGPEHVDGDLIELDASVLQAMRAEIKRVDGPALVPAALVGQPAERAVLKNHHLRTLSQRALRETMAMYGGWRLAKGDDLRMAQRRFFHRFGVDVMTAQTLGAIEADTLRQRIDAAMRVA